MASFILSNILENNHIANNLMLTNDYTYQILQALKHTEEAKKE